MNRSKRPKCGSGAVPLPLSQPIRRPTPRRRHLLVPATVSTPLLLDRGLNLHRDKLRAASFPALATDRADPFQKWVAGQLGITIRLVVRFGRSPAVRGGLVGSD